ncbi:MAG: DHA2 family efflux MFS transporter permease subunit [Chloroflexota bacterium]
MAAVATVSRPRAARTARLHGLAYHWQALIVVVLGSFSVILNQTVLNVALPRIIAVFEASVDQGQLVVTAYMVAMAVVIPACGYATDTFGARRAYLSTLSLFTVFTALCGLAPSIEGLIAFRVLQGLAGGMIMTLGLTIMFQAVPPRQRGSVMGVFGLPVLVAPMVGPIIGGYLVEFLNWRLIFGLGVPIGILSVLVGAAVLRPSAPREGSRFDGVGFTLIGVGFACALLALSEAPREGWTATITVSLGVVALVSIVAAVAYELWHPQPLIDLRVLGDRTYPFATAVSCVFMVGMFASSLLLPLFLQNVRGLGPLDTGLLLAPEAVASGLMMPFAGRLLDRFGPRPLVIPGLIATALSYWLLAGIDPNTSDTTLRLVLVLRGLAMGASMMPVITFAMDNISPARLPRATALGNVLRQLAGAFGTAFFASVLLDRQTYHQAILAQTATAGSASVIQLLSTTANNLMLLGVARDTADLLALSTLSRQVSQAATVRAFGDCFYLAAFFLIAGLVPALLLNRRRRAHS